MLESLFKTILAYSKSTVVIFKIVLLNTNLIGLTLRADRLSHRS